MEENKEDALKQALWKLGLTDRQIASVFNVDIDIITNWRTNLGLNRNQVGVKDIINDENSENKLKKALWELGLSDQQIANIFLISKSSIYYWRKKNGLQCNDKRRGSRLEKEEEEFRLKLWEENYSDEEIANATGLTKQSVIFWRTRRNLFKDKTNLERMEELSEKESIFLEYLKSKYPERADSFYIGLAKYVEPKVGGIPTVQQREFVRKIKVAGFKIIHYFDDGEYSNLDEAMDLFIKLNPNIDEDISKIRSGGMNRELYQIFLKRRDFNKQSAQVDANEKISTSNPLDSEPIKTIDNDLDTGDTQINLEEMTSVSVVLDSESIKTIDNDLDTGDTQINPEEITSVSVVLDSESIKIIDMSRGQQSRSAYINELIHTYGYGQDHKL